MEEKEEEQQKDGGGKRSRMRRREQQEGDTAKSPFIFVWNVNLLYIVDCYCTLFLMLHCDGSVKSTFHLISSSFIFVPLCPSIFFGGFILYLSLTHTHKQKHMAPGQ